MKSSNSNSVQAVPSGFRTVTPFLVVDDAPAFIEFLKHAFGGQLQFRMDQDDGKIMHATVQIGDSIIMITDTMEGMPPQPAMLYLYLEDVDAVFKQAVKAKATTIQEPRNEFYGDRAGAVKDAWGNTWWIASHVEDVSQQELERRAKKAMEEHKQKDPVHAH